MYNTYQNRVTTAREVYNQAVMNYNNAIKDARLQNNAALAEIAYQALQTQLELSLEGFQYKNNLIIEQANKKLEVENLYHSYYLDVLNQINTENALAENVRQFDANIAFQTEQAELDRQFQAKQAEIDRQFESAEAALDRQFKEAQAALDREHDKALLTAKNEQEKKMAEIEHQNKVKLLEKELENEKAAIEAEKQAQLAILDKQNPGSGSSGKGSSGIYTISDAYNQGKYGLTVANSPLSVEGAAKAVAEGKVTAEVKDGKIYLTNNPSYLAGQSTLDKYTLLNPKAFK